MKIVVLDGYLIGHGDVSWDALSALGEFVYYDRTNYSDVDEIVQRIGDAEAVFVNKVPMTEAVIKCCPNLKFIGEMATGFNNIDLKAASSKGIVVSNVPTYGTSTVAQFTIALLLEICNGVGHHFGAVRQGRWDVCPDVSFWDFPPIELSGKAFGVIGYGRIGSAAAAIASAMGMKVLAYHPSRVGEAMEYGSYVSFDTLLSESDVISLHCPLTEDTFEIINKETISKMKDGVIIINTGRGQLINEMDLRYALDTGKVRAAGVDVVSVEPIREENPLLGARNCIITPHMAWAATAARKRLMDVNVENLSNFIKGSPVNQVN